MEYVWAVVFIIVGFALLVKGADLFVDHASGLAKKIGMSPVVIGLTIVAFGTSLPELAVSVTAALEGANEIAVGNVVGSNIFNLLVVAGMSAVLCPLVINKTILKRDWPISGAIALLLAFFVWTDSKIERWEAIVLFVLFVANLIWQIKSGKQEVVEESSEGAKPMWRLILGLVLGIAGIIVGAELAVNGSTSVARLLGCSETLIGLTIVAIGTSLPELVTSVVAAKKGENEIAIGNVIGSNIFNILCILGVSGMIRPIALQNLVLFDTLFLVLITLLFWIPCRKQKMSRVTGIVMMILYVAYTAFIILR